MKNIKSSVKSQSESEVETRYLLMPHHANPNGTAFGGQIVSWIDIVGSMAAQRHCGTQVVTASIDCISFLIPIHIGDHVILHARLVYAGTTSMEVAVKVFREDPQNDERTLTTSAYLTFVSLDENNKPIMVPALKLDSPEDEIEFRHACERVKARKANKVKNC